MRLHFREALHHFRAQRRIGCSRLLRKKSAIEVDLDHAAFLPHGGDHFVGHVARHVGQCAAGGMRGEDGRAAYRESVPERFVRDVGDIDNHPQAVHFRDHALAEIGEAVIGFIGVARRIRPVVAIGVGEGHVTDAQNIIVAQKAQTVLNGVAAFNPHQRGDLPAAVRAFDVVRRGGVDKGIRVAFDDVVADGIYHFERTVRRRFVPGVFRAHVNREKLGAHATGAHARNIGVAVRAGLADIEPGHGGAGDVVMRVDQDGGFLDAGHFGLGNLGLREPVSCQEEENRRKVTVHAFYES